jgi:hypothetical protein
MKQVTWKLPNSIRNTISFFSECMVFERRTSYISLNKIFISFTLAKSDTSLGLREYKLIIIKFCCSQNKQIYKKKDGTVLNTQQPPVRVNKIV